MAIKEGTLLERNTKRLFSLLGFKTTSNIKIKGYEIDVLVVHNDKKIIVECKQRDKSETIDMRNLIHQWSSKNDIIGADKVVLVIYGIQTSQAHKSLGKKLGVIIWNDQEFETYMDMAIENVDKAKKIILKNLGISNVDFTENKIKIMTINQKKRFEDLKKTLQNIRGKNYELTNIRAMSQASGVFRTCKELALLQILSSDNDFYLIVPALEDFESEKFEKLAIIENWNYEIECKDPKHFGIIFDNIEETIESMEKILKNVYELDDNFNIDIEIVK